MTPERWRQITAIFHAAVVRDAAERPALVIASCGDDELLRREVESMLAAHHEAGSFGDTPLFSDGRAVEDESFVALAVGTRLGMYEILALLGVGGMGAVYRARDNKLDRDVALKVLLPALSGDPARLRFNREARVLASLNHANIAHIYGLEESDGIHAIAMELIEGPTLADRIGGGALPLVESLGIARQIAQGLEAAHERGVVHRDLKPANVKVRPDGTVKVLDFGLAKLAESRGIDVSDAPSTETLVGTILGTITYMPPEQAQGKPVDRRADLWAFGCVLFEVLTGQRAFVGETRSDVMVNILAHEPDWSELPVNTPPPIRSLLRRCLQKDPNRRLDSAAVARIEIDDALTMLARDATAVDMNAAVPNARWRGLLRPVVFVLVAAFGAGLGISLVTSERLPTGTFETRRASVQPIRFSVDPPIGGTMGSGPFALSRDGRHLVFAARTARGAQLYLRALEQLDVRALPGTEGALLPTFSPDGQWIAFVADGKLKKAPVFAAAPPITLSEFPNCCAGSSLTWLPDNNIVAGRMGGGIVRVSSLGGTPVELTQSDGTREIDLHSPQWLPGGKALLVAVHRGADTFDVAVLRLDTGERRVLIENAFDGRYVPTGHLVFARPGTLLAAAFDADRLEVIGPAVPVIENLATVNGDGAARYRLADDGSLAYIQSTSIQGRRLVWLDRRGGKEPVPIGPRGFLAPSLSPRGDRVAVQINETTRRDIWIQDLMSGVLSRVTFDGTSASPIWTPDGKRLVFSSMKDGRRQVYWQPADGTGRAELLVADEYSVWPGSWSPDLQTLAYVRSSPTAQNDLGLFRFDKSRSTTLVVAGTGAEQWPRISPDGRWLAYASSETGRFEVYVTSVSSDDGKRQVSTDGGFSPVWSRDGRELFYRTVDQVIVVSVETFPAAVGKRVALPVQARLADGTVAHPGYDVSVDGRRLLVVEQAEEEAAPPKLLVVLNWFEELRQRVPTR